MDARLKEILREVEYKKAPDFITQNVMKKISKPSASLNYKPLISNKNWLVIVLLSSVLTAIGIFATDGSSSKEPYHFQYLEMALSLLLANKFIMIIAISTMILYIIDGLIRLKFSKNLAY